MPTEVTLPVLCTIDGRSGSGKTQLAASMAAELGARVIHMDDLYAGWHGLATGSRLLERAILAPLAEGRSASWKRWDWETSDWGRPDSAEPGDRLIVEGCGSLTLASRQHTARALWLEAPETVRRGRALLRDGDVEWWSLWRAQEDTHVAANDPAHLADETIFTSRFPPLSPGRS